MYVEWRIVYSNRGKPIIECSIQDESAFYNKVVARVAKSSLEDDLYSDYINLTNSINALEHIVRPIIKDMVSARLCDGFLSGLDEKIYSKEGLLATSIACHRWYANQLNLPFAHFCANAVHLSSLSMPLPLFSFVNVGSHNAKTTFSIIPVDCHTYQEALLAFMCAYQSIKNSSCEKEEQLLIDLKKIFKKLYRDYNFRYSLGIGWNAHEKFNKKTIKYYVNGEEKTGSQLFDWYTSLAKVHDIVSWHNIFSYEDSDLWHAFAFAMKSLRKNCKMQISISSEFVNKIKIDMWDALEVDISAAFTVTEILFLLSSYKSAYGNEKNIILQRSSFGEDDTWLFDFGAATSLDQFFVTDTNNINYLLDLQKNLFYT